MTICYNVINEKKQRRRKTQVVILLAQKTRNKILEGEIGSYKAACFRSNLLLCKNYIYSSK